MKKYSCFVCDAEISGAMYGFGDGAGERFACDECYRTLILNEGDRKPLKYDYYRPNGEQIELPPDFTEQVVQGAVDRIKYDSSYGILESEVIGDE